MGVVGGRVGGGVVEQAFTAITCNGVKGKFQKSARGREECSSLSAAASASRNHFCSPGGRRPGR